MKIHQEIYLENITFKMFETTFLCKIFAKINATKVHQSWPNGPARSKSDKNTPHQLSYSPQEVSSSPMSVLIVPFGECYSTIILSLFLFVLMCFSCRFPMERQPLNWPWIMKSSIHTSLEQSRSMTYFTILQELPCSDNSDGEKLLCFTLRTPIIIR